MKAQAEELARRLDAERLLTRAAEIFGEDLEESKVLRNVADFCVGALADHCFVSFLESQGVSRTALARREPQEERVVLCKSETFAGPASLSDVPSPELLLDLPQDLSTAAARQMPELAVASGQGVRSAIWMPLLVRGELRGSLMLGRRDDRPRYGPDDVTLARELARAAATALEHARLYESAQHQLEERKLAEEALRKTEEQVRQSAKMEAIGRLAGGVAHDFNNLLMVILGYSDIALQTLGGDDPMVADLTQIKAAGLQAAKLTQQLLAFSRKQVLSPKVVNLNDLVASIMGFLRRIIGEDIRIDVQVEPALWAVRVDPDKITQVILNLAANARDAMAHGGTMTLTTANEPGTPEQVRLSVSDTGEGMDRETLAHVFEPFFTTKGRGKGTGLGLSTAFGMVEQSGGTLQARSTPGRGSRFDIYLPRCDGAPNLAAEKHSEEIPRGAETILLVEDEATVRAVIRQMLQSYGFKVVEAANGIEALQVMAQQGKEVALVLTDVIMPHMNGRQLAERIHAAWPEKRVIFMSGYTDDEVLPQVIGVTGAAFVQKPVTADALVRAVRGLLDRPS